jgi:hypothetical protein
MNPTSPLGGFVYLSPADKVLYTLSRARATCCENAVELDSSSAVAYLVEKGIVKVAPNGRYYLDSMLYWRGVRRRLIPVLIAFFVVLAALFYIFHQSAA